MRLLGALLAMTALGQDYIQWPISEDSTTACSMNTASIICAYEVQVRHDVKVREIYMYISGYTGGTMTIRVSVQADNGGVPSGIDMSYVDLTPAAGGTWVGGQLNVDAELMAGQTYWQVARYVEYGSGSLDVRAQPPSKLLSGSISRGTYRRYDGSTWSVGAVGAGMLMVDAHGWPVDPVPVINTATSRTNYTKTCRADRPMEIVGIVEWRHTSGQAASYTVTAQSGSGSGYAAAGATNDVYTFAYVWLDQPVRVGAGQSYTIQRTSSGASIRYGVTTGLPAKLANYSQPLCSGSNVLTWPIERPLRVVR